MVKGPQRRVKMLLVLALHVLMLVLQHPTSAHSLAIFPPFFDSALLESLMSNSSSSSSGLSLGSSSSSAAVVSFGGNVFLWKRAEGAAAQDRLMGECQADLFYRTLEVRVPAFRLYVPHDFPIQFPPKSGYFAAARGRIGMHKLQLLPHGLKNVSLFLRHRPNRTDEICEFVDWWW